MMTREKWIEMLKDGSPESHIDCLLSQNLPSLQPTQRFEPCLTAGGPGFLGCFSWLKGIPLGHFEATVAALNEFDCGLEEKVVNSIGRAARLPDILYFDNLEYHAMSYSNCDKLPLNNLNSLQKSTNLFHNVSVGIDSALDDLRFTDLLFHFGVYFHLIQDLAVHQGMTNPEHAFLDKEGRSPDSNEELFALAVKLSKKCFESQFLEKIKKISSSLNLMEEMVWGQYETVRNYINSAISGVEYSVNAIESYDSRFITRWFDWQSGATFEDIEPSIKKIFPL